MRTARLSVWILPSIDVATSLRLAVEATTGANDARESLSSPMVIPAVLATASSSSVFFMYWMLLLGVERSPAHIRPLSERKVKHLRTSNHIVASATTARKHRRVAARCRIALKTKDIRVIRAPHNVHDARTLAVEGTLRQNASNRLHDHAGDDVTARAGRIATGTDDPFATQQRHRANTRVVVEEIDSTRAMTRRVGLLAFAGRAR